MRGLKFIKLQLALFFSDRLEIRPDKISHELNEESGNLFDADPMILPIPDDAPSGISIVQLKSKAQTFTNGPTYQCNISKKRSDFLYLVPKEKMNIDFPSQITKEKEKLQKYFSFFRRLCRIERVGYITEFFLLKQDGSAYIRDKFLHTKYESSDFSQLTIRFNNKKETGQFKLNNITKLEPAILLIENSSGIRIERDINTVPEISYNFNDQLFQNFRDIAEREFSFGKIKELFR